MSILETIFTQPPPGCNEIRISCRVYFKPVAQYILTGWLHVGATWQRLEAQADQLPITEAQLDAVTQRAGWAMEGRPSRRSTTEFLYTFKPATGAHAFGLHSKTDDYVDRRRLERLATLNF